MNENAATATVISICPFPISEFKPGLFPNTYNLDAVKPGDIGILNIPDTVYYKHRIPVVGNVITVPVPATQLAESIVADRMTGQLLYSETSKPGLFWVKGTYNKTEVRVKFAAELAVANLLQKQWFADLVKLADDDWNEHHQHKYISDLQRHAAKDLNLERDWLVSVITDVDKKCIACYSNMHINAAICPTCKTDQEEFAAKRAKK